MVCVCVWVVLYLLKMSMNMRAHGEILLQDLGTPGLPRGQQSHAHAQCAACFRQVFQAERLENTKIRETAGCNFFCSLTSEMSASVASHNAEIELMLLTRCARKAEMIDIVAPGSTRQREGGGGWHASTGPPPFPGMAFLPLVLAFWPVMLACQEAKRDGCAIVGCPQVIDKKIWTHTKTDKTKSPAASRRFLSPLTACKKFNSSTRLFRLGKSISRVVYHH